MSLVNLQNKEDVPAEIAAFYDQLDKEYGFVPNIVKTIANCPNLLKVFLPLWAEVYRSPVIGPKKRAVAALGTAFSQNCEYCIGPMTQSALNSGLSKDEVDTISQFDYENMMNDDALILEYSRVLTAEPDKVDDQLRMKLKAVYSDEEIVAITMVIAMYNFTSRVLKGLNIEPDKNAVVKANISNKP